MMLEMQEITTQDLQPIRELYEQGQMLQAYEAAREFGPLDAVARLRGPRDGRPPGGAHRRAAALHVAVAVCV